MRFKTNFRECSFPPCFLLVFSCGILNSMEKQSLKIHLSSKLNLTNLQKGKVYPRLLNTEATTDSEIFHLQIMKC